MWVCVVGERMGDSGAAGSGGDAVERKVEDDSAPREVIPKVFKGKFVCCVLLFFHGCRPLLLLHVFCWISLNVIQRCKLLM